VAGSQALDDKISVNCAPENTPDSGSAAEVTMKFHLVVPVVNWFLSGVLKFRDHVNPTFSTSKDGFKTIVEGSLNEYSSRIGNDIFPHITITRRAVVPANPKLAD
jgi:hypothetical protein